MTIDEIKQYQSLDEAISALRGDLWDLNQEAKLARRAGNHIQIGVIHGLIDEELDLLQFVEMTRDNELRAACLPVFSDAPVTA